MLEFKMLCSINGFNKGCHLCKEILLLVISSISKEFPFFLWNSLEEKVSILRHRKSVFNGIKCFNIPNFIVLSCDYGRLWGVRHRFYKAQPNCRRFYCKQMDVLSILELQYNDKSLDSY